LLTGTDAAVVLPSIMRGLHALQVPASKPNLTQVLPVLASVGHNVIITEAVLGEASHPTLLHALHSINMKHQVSVTHAHAEGSVVATQVGPVAPRNAGKALVRIVSGMAQAPGTMYLGSQLNHRATQCLSGSDFNVVTDEDRQEAPSLRKEDAIVSDAMDAIDDINKYVQGETTAGVQEDDSNLEGTNQEGPSVTKAPSIAQMNTQELVDKVLADIDGSKNDINKLASKAKEKFDTAAAALNDAGKKQATIAQEVSKAQAKLKELTNEYEAAKSAYEEEKKKSDSKVLAAKKTEGKYNKELEMIKEIKAKVRAQEEECAAK